MANSGTHDALERLLQRFLRDEMPNLTPAELAALESQFEDRFRDLVERASGGKDDPGSPQLVDLVTGSLIAVAAALVGLAAIYAFPVVHAAFHRLGSPIVVLTVHTRRVDGASLVDAGSPCTANGTATMAMAAAIAVSFTDKSPFHLAQSTET